MIKNGIFTIYQGKEYILYRGSKGGQVYFRIRSSDSNDIELGFRLSTNGNPNCFVKDISPSDVSEVFSIRTFALYQGQKCSVEGEDTEHYFLRVEQRSIADKLNFDIRDRDDFVKTVVKQDVEKIFEEKTLMPNYFK